MTRMTNQMFARRAALALALVLAPTLLTGCADSAAATTASEDCVCAPDTVVVDPALLAFLSKAKVSHKQADLAEADEDSEAALRSLDGLTSGPHPGGDTPPAEVREVLADTFARSAELRSQSSYEAAVKDVNSGLSLAPERTHYRGRLMEVMGVVEQRQFKRLAADRADDPAAAAAKERALKAFEEAVAIQDDVIKRALEADE